MVRPVDPPPNRSYRALRVEIAHRLLPRMVDYSSLYNVLDDPELACSLCRYTCFQ